MRHAIAGPAVSLALLACVSCAKPEMPGETRPPPAAPAAAMTAEPGKAASTQAQVLPAPVFPAFEALLRADDTLETAQARLGTAAVRAEPIHHAEGEMLDGWVLYPDDPTRRVEVFLDDAGQRPVLLRVDSEDSAWVRADGVRIGATTAELQTLNGRPFAFYGFGWDYGGTVSDWQGGALDARDKDAAHGGFVRLSPPADAGDDYPTGDDIFSSDDPRVVAQPARVYAFSSPVGG